MRMKQLLLVPILALSLALGGCETLTALGNAVKVAGQEITNPITSTNIYQVKLTYAAAQELVLEYRRKCWSAPLAQINGDPVLGSICKNRRARYRAMQLADRNAYAAIRTADDFIKNNPTGNAVSYITAAWKAVNDFKALAS